MWRRLPPRFATRTSGIQSGKCFGRFFMKCPGPSIPFGNASIATGRSRMCRTITRPTRS